MFAAARWGVLAAVAVLATAGADRAAAATGPSASVGPTVSGVARQGERLVAAAGVWSGSGTVSYRFQWYRCNALGARCSSISGATASGYRVTARDVGGTIGLTVRATDSTGTTNAHASLVGPVARSGAPAPRVQPAVTGVAAVGGRLTVANGTWTATPASFVYAWFRCNESGRVCVAIAGATTPTYTVVEADRGRALIARVTATVGSTSQASYSTRTVVPETAGPSASVGPSASGIARRGRRLLAAPGTWSGSGTVSYRFQWYRCNALGARCRSISGATAAGYRLGLRDVGGTIGLTVRATDSTGTTSAHASLVGPIAAAAPALAARVQPAIAGTPAGGQALTVGNGAWTAKPSVFAYAWFRCNSNGRLCAAISGATASRYTVRDADRGHALVARVTAGTGTRAHASLSTRSFVAKPEGPSLTVGPTVAGVARQGERLAAQPGTWTGAGTLGYRYQWYRCNALGARCSSISGATASGYRLGARDVGNTVGLTVRATDSTGTASAFASLVGPVASAGLLAAGVQPAITGVAALGGRLTVGNGTWTATPASFAYAWFRCNENGRVCAAIAGATEATYVAGEADRGRALVARVTATLGVTSSASYSTRAVVAR